MTNSCATMGPTCRGCPDCQGIPPGSGVGDFRSPAEEDTDRARAFVRLPGFQGQATELMIEACGDDPTDFAERRARFAEEALEAAYEGGATAADLHALVDHVTRNPRVGTPAALREEIAQSYFTLAVLSSYAGVILFSAGYDELRAMDTPERLSRFRRKRAGRHGRGSLPGKDPQAAPTS